MALVEFLNLNPSRESDRRLIVSGDYLPVGRASLSPKQHIDQFWQARNELVMYLRGIAEPPIRQEILRGDSTGAISNNVRTSWERLEFLCSKINSVGLKLRFQPFFGGLKTPPIEYEAFFPWTKNSWVGHDGKWGNTRYKNGARALLNAKQKLLTLSGAEFIVDIDFHPSLADYRQVYFGIVAEGLVSGKISKLRRCRLKSCRAFFLARDERERFCTGHAKEFHNDPYQSKLRHLETEP